MISKKIREEVYNKYNRHCAYCGVELTTIKDMQVDHIIPKRDDYIFLHFNPTKHIDHISNLNSACRVCNNFKTAMCLETFRSELQKQSERCRKYSVNFRMAEKFKQIQVTEFPIKFYFETCGD